MPQRKILLAVALTLTTLLVWLASETIFDFKGHFQGIFLLTGRDNHRWVLKDDLFLGDGPRVLFFVPFDPFRHLFTPPKAIPTNGRSHLTLEWDSQHGDGSITNSLPDGTAIQTFFSRFTDEYGLEAHGLFVGGGEASAALKTNNRELSNTGMTYFNGQRWLHLWCNANEAIATPVPRYEAKTPSSWSFLDSKVLINNSERVVIRSRHQVEIGGVPLRIERFVYFRAGATFFKLGIKITNIGDHPLDYSYFYGDEPWVGEYGTSLGNIGWANGHFFPNETVFNPMRDKYAGMVDIYTNTANFIEWFGPFRPSHFYISNQNGVYSEIDHNVPLVSNERYIGLVWGPQIIRPGETNQIYLAIGMAPFDPRRGVPVKPEIPLSDYLKSLDQTDLAP